HAISQYVANVIYFTTEIKMRILEGTDLNEELLEKRWSMMGPAKTPEWAELEVTLDTTGSIVTDYVTGRVFQRQKMLDGRMATLEEVGKRQWRVSLGPEIQKQDPRYNDSTIACRCIVCGMPCLKKRPAIFCGSMCKLRHSVGGESEIRYPPMGAYLELPRRPGSKWDSVVEDMAVGDYKDVPRSGDGYWYGLYLALRRAGCHVRTSEVSAGTVRVWKLSPVIVPIKTPAQKRTATLAEARADAPDWYGIDRRLALQEKVTLDALVAAVVLRRWKLAGYSLAQRQMENGQVELHFKTTTPMPIKPSDLSDENGNKPLICYRCWHPFLGRGQSRACSDQCKKVLKAMGGIKAAGEAVLPPITSAI
ncbi:MAG: hypothetical protein KGL39_51890, partial [Patescibacteria group bacterium]|nr:hypothetical protein [Patescibacteria group bacterium]